MKQPPYNNASSLPLSPLRIILTAAAVAFLIQFSFAPAFAGPGPNFRNPITEYILGGDINLEVRVNNYEKVKKMLKKYPKRVNSRDKYSKTPLHYARTGEMAELLISKGADLNAMTNWKYDKMKTPLECAIQDERDTVAVAIIGAGCDLTLKDEYGATPLAVACSRRRATVVKKIVEKGGADLNVKFNSYPVLVSTPLGFAIESGEADLAVDILKKGGIFDDAEMQLAIYKKTPDIIKRLAASGAKFDLNEALHKALIASDADNQAIIEYLVTAGADINYGTATQESSPMHCAVWGGKLAAIEFLVKKGAKFNSYNQEGKRPYSAALDMSADPHTTAEGKEAAKKIIEYFKKIGAKK